MPHVQEENLNTCWKQKWCNQYFGTIWLYPCLLNSVWIRNILPASQAVTLFCHHQWPGSLLPHLLLASSLEPVTLWNWSLANSLFNLYTYSHDLFLLLPCKFSGWIYYASFLILEACGILVARLMKDKIKSSSMQCDKCYPVVSFPGTVLDKQISRKDGYSQMIRELE